MFYFPCHPGLPRQAGVVVDEFQFALSSKNWNKEAGKNYGAKAGPSGGSKDLLLHQGGHTDTDTFARFHLTNLIPLEAR